MLGALYVNTRSIKILLLILATAVVLPACNNKGRNPGGPGSPGTGGNGADMGVPEVGTITVAPGDVTLDFVQSQPPQTQAFTVTFHGMSGDQDVTGSCGFALSDMTIGSMSANTFSTGTDHGGTTQLIATCQASGGTSQTATATIHVRVKGTVQGPDCNGGCGTFPPDSAPPCGGTGVAAQVVYPPDGVLLPPNLNVISVHWTPFPGAPPKVQLFEVDFKNGNTDVRVLTKCATQTTDTTGAASGGCELVLDPATWNLIAKSNRGGDSVGISVRATSDGTCATGSTNTVHAAVAEEDLNGGLFYWKSSITSGGVGGNIWAKSFGDAVPEEQITGVAGTNLATQGCFGCHALSRDGKKMVVNFDDADSDDEYGDMTHTLVDVMTKTSIDGHIGDRHFEPGFQSFNADHSIYVGTDGDGTAPGNFLYQFDGNTGAALAPAQVPLGTAGARPTMIDWSADSKSLLYVLPARVATWDGTQRNDDDHIFGGSIYAAPFDPATKTFGAPTAIVMSQGENNYYPSYSPDGSFIAFNRVQSQMVSNPIANQPDCTGSGQQITCPNDSFSNPKARVWLLNTKPGSMPVDAENANGSPAANPVDVSNSWPRWSPFVQMYKGSKLLWVTFSSTRDYGLRVLNHKSGMFQCYPADSLEQAGGTHRAPFPTGCQQPQVWMAAINLTHLEFNSADPSFAAFWLPYQDITTHNHTAQWTQTVVTQPQPDMGACIPNGGDCTKNPNACCGGICTGTGVCGIP